MTNRLVSTTHRISGVTGDMDVQRILQELFDIFTRLGVGQATVELDGDEQRLVLKHQPGRPPDRKAIADALARAGAFGLID